MKKDAEVKILTGGRGSGKTTNLSENIDDKKRVLVLDPLESVNLKGFTRLKSLDAVYKHIKANWSKGWKIILETGDNKTMCLEVMQKLARDLLIIQQPYKDSNKDMQGKEITLVVDEADMFIPNPPSGDLQDALEKLILRGRHWGIEMICATQSVTLVWTLLRKNAMHYFVFRQGDHNDIDTLVSILGKDQRQEIMKLATHEFLHLDKTEGLTVKKGKNLANFK